MELLNWLIAKLRDPGGYLNPPPTPSCMQLVVFPKLEKSTQKPANPTGSSTTTEWLQLIMGKVGWIESLKLLFLEIVAMLYNLDCFSKIRSQIS